MTSAIGATDCWELDNDIDIQRIAANTIDAYMAKTVMERTHSWLLQVTDRLTTEEVGSVALVAVPRIGRDRDTRGGKHAQRLTGNHFYGSYDKINYDDWSDRETRPPPRTSGREWQ